MSKPEQPNSLGSFNFITDAVDAQSTMHAQQTEAEKKHAGILGRLQVIQEGVITDMQPFQAIYEGTRTLLRDVKPTKIKYEPHNNYPMYLPRDTRETTRKGYATAEWTVPNIFVPSETIRQVDVTIQTLVTVRGNLTRQSKNDELLYAFWYLNYFNMVTDRKQRKSLRPLRSLLNVPVKRGHTEALEQAIGNELLDRGSMLQVRVTETNASPNTEPLANFYAKDPASVIAKPNSGLLPDTAQSLYNNYQQLRGYTNNTDEDHIFVWADTFLRNQHFGLPQDEYSKLQDINLLLKKEGYAEAS